MALQEQIRKLQEASSGFSPDLVNGLLDTMPVAIFWKDKDLKYLGCNNLFARDAGYSDPNEIIGKNDYQLAWREWADLYRQNDLEVIETGIPKITIEEPLKIRSGAILTVLTSKTPLRNAGKEIIGVLGTYMDISELKKTQKELQESEEKLREVMENSIDAPYKRNLISNNYDYLSPAFTHITGYTPEEMKSMPVNFVLDLIHPDDLAEVERVMDLAMSGSSVHNNSMEYRFRHKDGGYQWLLDKFNVIYQEGVPIAIIGNVSDISRFKKAERLLRENTEQLNQILEATSGGVWDWNIPSGDATFSNGYSGMLGFQPDEFATAYKTWKNLVHPDDVERVHQEHMDHFHRNKEFSIEYRMMEKSGNWHWILSKGLLIERDSQGNPLRMVGTHTDIQERKLAEQKILESEIRFRTLSESELIGVYIVKNNQMAYVNPALASIFGYEPAELTGVSPLVVIHPDDRALVTENLRRRVDGEVDKIQYEFLGLCKNGEIKNIEVRGVRVIINNETAIIGNIIDLTQRRQAEDEIKRYQNHLETLVDQRTKEIAMLSQLVFVSLEAASVGAWWIDFTEVDTYHALDTTAIMIGVPVSGLPDKSYRISEWVKILRETQMRVPEYSGEVNDALEQFEGTISGKYEKYRVIYPILLSGQNVKWIDARADVTSRDKDGKALRMTGTLIDVTKSMTIEKELKAHKIQLEKLVAQRTEELEQRNRDLQLVTERLSLATRAAKIGIWDWNVLTDQLDWDNTMYEINCMRRGHSGITYDAWLHTIHPDDKAYVEAEIQAALHGEREFAPVFRIVWPDDSIHYIQASSLTFHTPDGKPSRMVGINHDITFQKQAENERKESELRFRAFVEQAPVAIGVFQLNGLGTYANQKFLETLGLPGLEDMIGRPAYEYFSSQYREDSKERIRRRLLGLPVPTIYEAVAKRSDGSEFPMQVAVASINISDQILNIAFLFDLTEIKRFEKELIISKEKAEESDRLKSAFLANMSHEIRTPMNGILGFAELLKEPELTGEEQHNYIRMIEKGGVRMLNIINNLISISKVEAGLMEINLSETNIDEQIDFIYNFFKPEAERKMIQLITKRKLPLKGVVVKTDREKVYAILTNLINNSIKYTKEGSIEFGYEKTDCCLEFFVKDTGIGIPADRQEAIFQRFIQADFYNKQAMQGAGLGLSISKAYVELLGGKIWLESDSEKGSTFYFTIPYTNGLNY